MSKFQGKVAVVTGGTSGIGLATAQRLVQEGAYVFITGRREKELQAAVRIIGKNVTGVQGDVANLADLDKLYAKVKEEKGQLDILFANAGTAGFSALESVTEEHYDEIFNTNVKGLLFSVQKALPLLRDGSSIILNASIVASSGSPAFGVYSATKAAVRSFARSWTSDLKARKIRVNAVSPGVTDTAGLTMVQGGEDASNAFKTGVLAHIPLGRVGKPDDIASAVLFLASDESSWISGIELTVDGGMTQV